MEYIDVVDEDDNVIGVEPLAKVFAEGLRRRNSNILVFEQPDLRKTLVTRRSAMVKNAPLKLSLSGGHVNSGESYETAARRELKEELFYRLDLPNGIILVEIARYVDYNPEKKENLALFYTEFPGPFSPDPEEVAEVYWQDRHQVWEDITRNPGNYTSTIAVAMRKLKEYLREPV
jgi:8-oxo-dGTP pyrophosphatase MutT (NUDIX family)